MAAREVGFEIIRPNQVFDVEEGCALLADVDERCLHAGQHARLLAKHDVADGASSGRALDLQLGNHSPFDQRNTGFTNIAIDDQRIFGHVPRTKRFSREKEIFRVDLALLPGSLPAACPKGGSVGPNPGQNRDACRAAHHALDRLSSRRKL